MIQQIIQHLLQLTVLTIVQSKDLLLKLMELELKITQQKVGKQKIILLYQMLLRTNYTAMVL